MGIQLSVSNLTKTYLRDNQIFIAVNDLSFDVSRGEVLGFLGPNGAGKTTTIKMICGLIDPSSGKIIVDNKNIRTDHYGVMQSIGAVLEGNRNIYWHMTAYQNLMYFGRLKCQSGNKLIKQAEKLLKEFDLYHVKDERVGRFSRGMQQKVAIACALIHNPGVILLDEPTLGLDVEASRMLKETITLLAEQEKKTIILTTHQLDVADELCDRIIVINQGKILVNTKLEDLKQIVYDHHVTKYQITLDTKEPINQDIINNAKCTVEGNRIIYTFEFKSEKELTPILTYLLNKEVPIVTVQRIEPTLEDIFVFLTKKKE